MQPGVGTNRFSYSFNDPINLADPSGIATVYKDMDGDGWSEYYGTISYGQPGFDDDFSESGIQPSEWVDFNNASKGGGGNGGGSQTVQMGCVSCLNEEMRFGQPVQSWRQANPAFIAKYDLLGRILADQKFITFALERLQAGNYLNYNASWEMTGHIYVSKNGGIRYEALPKHAKAQRDSTPILDPTPRAGEMSVMFHTHPVSFSVPSKGIDADTGAAGAFHARIPGASNLGLIVTARGIIWDHNDKGYR